MTDIETAPEPTEPPAPDPAQEATTEAFSDVMDAMVELIRSGVRPEVVEAQRLLLLRLATQGDVFPSRIPPPRNITEVGGYLNALETAGHFDMRSSAMAAALGVAGPGHALGGLAGPVPVGFIEISNDRPAGPVQPSIPPLVTIRADFHAPLTAALGAIHAAGCLLPLRASPPLLPPGQPGIIPSSLEAEVVLAALGRALAAFPGTFLVDPAADALAIARPESPADGAFRLVAREIDGGGLVPEASWVAKRDTDGVVGDDPAAAARYLDVAPILEAAGWYHPTPLVEPTSLAEPGTLARLHNVTGLIAGETTLGTELDLLYTPAAIAQSIFASLLAWRWDGTAFVAPA